MTYNTCSTCGADNGRCGITIITEAHRKPECNNCYTTRQTGNVFIDANLQRTQKELSMTMAILST